MLVHRYIISTIYSAYAIATDYCIGILHACNQALSIAGTYSMKQHLKNTRPGTMEIVLSRFHWYTYSPLLELLATVCIPVL